jgi:flagellar hook-basal body complex protein FliE
VQIKGIDELLSQLRAAEAFAAGRPAAGGPARPQEGTGVDFAGALHSALDRVSASQNRALELARGFETGEKDIALHEVMLAMQKANIAFQATVQVRNRLVSAYQDIMNMPI